MKILIATFFVCVLGFILSTAGLIVVESAAKSRAAKARSDAASKRIADRRAEKESAASEDVPSPQMLEDRRSSGENRGLEARPDRDATFDPQPSWQADPRSEENQRPSRTAVAPQPKTTWLDTPKRSELLGLIQDDLRREHREIESLHRESLATVNHVAPESPQPISPAAFQAQVQPAPTATPAGLSNNAPNRLQSQLSEMEMVRQLAGSGQTDAAADLLRVMKDHQVARVLSGLPDTGMAEQLLNTLTLQSSGSQLR